MSVGGAVAAAAMRLYRVHRESKDAETWILVANMNTLLRLDLDHITGDDRNEAALGGIAEIANDDHASRSDQTVQKTATSAPALAARANGHQGRVRATTALTAIAVPASGARM